MVSEPRNRMVSAVSPSAIVSLFISNGKVAVPELSPATMGIPNAYPAGVPAGTIPGKVTRKSCPAPQVLPVPIVAVPAPVPVTTFTPTTSPSESATNPEGNAAVTVICVVPLASPKLVRAFPSPSASDSVITRSTMVTSAESLTSSPSTVADPIRVTASAPSSSSMSSRAINWKVPVFDREPAGMLMSI